MHKRFWILPLWLVVSATTLLAAEGDKLFFSRYFPGSKPEYFDVTVHTDGKVSFRESLDDKMPLEFDAPERDVSRLFEISEHAGYFAQPLEEPKRKTAFTGEKILRYTHAGGSSSQVEFVRADDEALQEMVGWFARVADTAGHRINLERTLQFDRLGVNKAILQFHAAFDRGQVVAPRQFLPLLRDIANNMKIVHLARSRAAGLAERIEAGAVGGE